LEAYNESIAKAAVQAISAELAKAGGAKTKEAAPQV
jgi:hypothetical protein